jgi:hypothetical protein
MRFLVISLVLLGAAMNSWADDGGEEKKGRWYQVTITEKDYCLFGEWDELLDEKQEEVRTGDYDGVAMPDLSKDYHYMNPSDPHKSWSDRNDFSGKTDQYRACVEFPMSQGELTVPASDMSATIDSFKKGRSARGCIENTALSDTSAWAAAVCERNAFLYELSLVGDDNAQVTIFFENDATGQICGSAIIRTYSKIGDEPCAPEQPEAPPPPEPPECDQLRTELQEIERRCQAGELAYCREVGLKGAQLGLAGCN